ncbi:hypothetical protein ACERZ8_04400 [Tateyamaria armeniaca]|uniref:DUF2842 domain-containing protein n=1 Tax=Tateyamaria armeniaca TaxID=2518930 RepID=A0ABW8UVE2_9RHOB
MARKTTKSGFPAFLKRRRQDHYAFGTVWLAMALIWLLFPGLVERGERYSSSVRFIVVAGLPMWLAINYIVYRGWLGGRKGKKK